jgi:hypothetical protein
MRARSTSTLALSPEPHGSASISNSSLQDGARLRRVRVVRDYGMFDRREAPQYYPDVKSAGAICR